MTPAMFFAGEAIVWAYVLCVLVICGPKIPTRPYARKHGVSAERERASIAVKAAQNAYLETRPVSRFLLPRTVVAFALGFVMALFIVSVGQDGDVVTKLLGYAGLVLQIGSAAVFSCIAFPKRKAEQAAVRAAWPDK